MNKVLIIDDEYSIRESFSLILQGKYDISFAASGEGGIKAAADNKFDLAYLDIRMPGINGLETLKRLKEIDPSLEVVMVTAVNDVQKASVAIGLGARDYIIKPFDVQSILKMTESILNRKHLLSQGSKLQKEEHDPIDPVGNSDKITKLVAAVQKSAERNAKILLLGEQGTEKEEIAHIFHQSGPFPDLQFRTLNLKSENSPEKTNILLFGKTRGMTTVDLEKTPGILEEVKAGTLFINNIEYLSAGINSLNGVSARIAAGSNLQNLAEIQHEVYGYFSENVVTIPPLRERTADILFLANYFVEKFTRKHNKPLKGLAKKTESVFLSYPWPGNTAELKSVIERAVLTAPHDTIEPNDLPFELLLA